MNTMQDNLIHFVNVEWEHPQEGVKQKVYSNGDKQLRLLRFNDNFIEHDWCTKGHVGYVLCGEMKIDFDGEIKRYSQGDGLWIDAGEQSKHKVSIEKGNQVELILFESK
jgi:hypothetical protein